MQGANRENHCDGFVGKPVSRDIRPGQRRRLDIVTNEFNSAPQVLISDLSDRHAIHWLKVKLVGTASNRDGLGATVHVTAGGRR